MQYPKTNDRKAHLKQGLWPRTSVPFCGLPQRWKLS
jgi:hypothetical protein